MMLRRIAVEHFEAHLGRMLTEPERIRLGMFDALLMMLEMSVHDMRVALHAGRLDLVDQCATFAHSALRKLHEL